MANALQEQLLTAIDFLVKNRVEALPVDKTVVATIVSCVNAERGEYKASYNGGIITAFSKDTTNIYEDNTTVYITIPLNDFSQQKFILGKVQNKTEDGNISAVSAAASDYNIIGANVIADKNINNKVYPVSMSSYLTKNYKLLYSYNGMDGAENYNPDTPDWPLLHVDSSALGNNLQQAEALMLEASFLTRLPKDHRFSTTGNYGLQFIIAFEDEDEATSAYSQSLAVMTKKAEILKPGEATDKPEQGLTVIERPLTGAFDSLEVAMTEAKNKIDLISKNTELDMSSRLELIDKIREEVKTILSEASKLGQETVKMTDKLFEKDSDGDIYGSKKEAYNFSNNDVENIQELYNQIGDVNLVLSPDSTPDQNVLNKHKYLETIYALQELENRVVDFESNPSEFDKYIKESAATNEELIKEIDRLKNIKTAPKIKYLSYVLDIKQMTGNPFKFLDWSDQYVIFPLEGKKFLYIDSILAFAEDFVKEDNIVQATIHGEDILIKDLEIYGLTPIAANSDGYALRISTPRGNSFRNNNKSDDKLVVAKVEKNKQALSVGCTYKWFKKDNTIDASSEGDVYDFYAGAGWRKLSKSGSTISLTAAENKSFKNEYLCIVNYSNSMILKEQFTIYNEVSGVVVKISSSLGEKFSFDRGKPKLTCWVNGQEKPEGNYKFIWSKSDGLGNSIIFNKTIEDLEKENEDINKRIKKLHEESLAPEISEEDKKKKQEEVLRLRQNLIQNNKKAVLLDGVIFTGNTLEYPVKQIENKAIFTCSVIQNNEVIGESSITLLNETAASPADYSIVIENGDQVFQYSESGVSPTHDRNENPQKIKPLTCHFFDPVGLEVNQKTYSVKWVWPLTNTMIETPLTGLDENPVTQKLEWYNQHICNFNIKDKYISSYNNNQFKAIITYNGKEFTKETNFLFTKIGENGTNGTDVVARILPVESTNKVLETDLLMLTGNVHTNNGHEEIKDFTWNTGINGLDSQKFNLTLYHNNEGNSNPTSVTWSIPKNGNKQDYFTITNGTLELNNNNNTGLLEESSLTIKAATKENGQTYYAFYPFCYMQYNEGMSSKAKIRIDRDNTSQFILYNSDGRNPIYDDNHGVSVEVTRIINLDKKPTRIAWNAIGGYKNENPEFKLYTLDKAGNKKFITENNKYLYTDSNADNNFSNHNVYIMPNDTATGAFYNQKIVGTIYIIESDPKIPEQHNYLEIGKVYIPIHVSLNTYGLASLNAWDGHSVDVNDAGKYILAPQIGAGEKNDKNQFTGILMGAETTYDINNEELKRIGLFGYREGKQSIFLDSETGNATFGFAEDDVDVNGFAEGRIELKPGGESRIGRWSIGSNDIFNISTIPNPVIPFYPLDYSIGIGSEVYTINGFLKTGVETQETLPLSDEYVYKTKENESIVDKTVYLNLWKKVLLKDLQQKDRYIYYYKTGSLINPDYYAMAEIATDGSIPSDMNSATTGIVIKGNTCRKYIKVDKPDGKLEDIIDKNSYVTAYTDRSQIAADTVYSEYNDKSKDYMVKNSKIAIPYNSQGMILGANPPYVSVKTGPITGHSGFDFDNANSTIKSGDSFEVEIDPNKTSVFSIYRHTVDENNKAKKTKYPLVGINSAGQFYSNALQDGNTTMGIGPVGAFGVTANAKQYLGANFAYGENNINMFKFYIGKDNLDGDTKVYSPLYMSTGRSIDSEYTRDIKIYGQGVGLYAAYDKSEKNEEFTSTTPSNLIEVQKDKIVSTSGKTKTILDRYKGIITSTDGNIITSVSNGDQLITTKLLNNGIEIAHNKHEGSQETPVETKQFELNVNSGSLKMESVLNDFSFEVKPSFSMIKVASEEQVLNHMYDGSTAKPGKTTIFNKFEMGKKSIVLQRENAGTLQMAGGVVKLSTCTTMNNSPQAVDGITKYLTISQPYLTLSNFGTETSVAEISGKLSSIKMGVESNGNEVTFKGITLHSGDGNITMQMPTTLDKGITYNNSITIHPGSSGIRINGTTRIVNHDLEIQKGSLYLRTGSVHVQGNIYMTNKDGEGIHWNKSDITWNGRDAQTSKKVNNFIDSSLLNKDQTLTVWIGNNYSKKGHGHSNYAPLSLSNTVEQLSSRVTHLENFMEQTYNIHYHGDNMVRPTGQWRLKE